MIREDGLDHPKAQKCTDTHSLQTRGKNRGASHAQTPHTQAKKHKERERRRWKCIISKIEVLLWQTGFA